MFLVFTPRDPVGRFPRSLANLPLVRPFPRSARCVEGFGPLSAVVGSVDGWGGVICKGLAKSVAFFRCVLGRFCLALVGIFPSFFRRPHVTGGFKARVAVALRRFFGDVRVNVGRLRPFLLRVRLSIYRVPSDRQGALRFYFGRNGRGVFLILGVDVGHAASLT